MTFTPDKELLEEIGWDSKQYSNHAEFSPKNQKLEDELSNHVDAEVENIRMFYGDNFDVKNLNTGKISGVAWEALKNSWLHNQSKESFKYGVFTGSKGILHCFQDNGDYFKKPEIKQQYESKHPVTNFEKADFCHGKGVNDFIFPDSDKIKVDSDKGILYCVQYLDNLKVN